MWLNPTEVNRLKHAQKFFAESGPKNILYFISSVTNGINWHSIVSKFNVKYKIIKYEYITACIHMSITMEPGHSLHGLNWVINISIYTNKYLDQ